MEDLNSINENINDSSVVNNSFLDSLDTDMSFATDLNTIQDENTDNKNIDSNTNIEVSEECKEECTALVITKPNSLFVAQTMFKKSIKISIKSFLISLSLGFLNLFL